MGSPMICQSCTMPIADPKDRGTEKDGSSTNEYCKYCYQQGKFTNPRMTYNEMKIFLTQKMRELNLPDAGCGKLTFFNAVEESNRCA